MSIFIATTGQASVHVCTRVPMPSIDSLGLGRADLLRLDVEGMESEVLRGAAGGRCPAKSASSSAWPQRGQPGRSFRRRGPAASTS
ncbi:FkbM family methyltransferase [Paraburkholderia kururiensis]|uniref:FkbM family methyltransferase n=1 Tax=Paraburkholderia kururiensis TaxID=984307 RepID=UPI002D7FCF59|nr:FkbM family methyltransferase [Paraburkholderia kururiensis]